MSSYWALVIRSVMIGFILLCMVPTRQLVPNNDFAPSRLLPPTKTQQPNPAALAPFAWSSFAIVVAICVCVLVRQLLRHHYPVPAEISNPSSLKEHIENHLTLDKAVQELVEKHQQELVQKVSHEVTERLLNDTGPGSLRNQLRLIYKEELRAIRAKITGRMPTVYRVKRLSEILTTG